MTDQQNFESSRVGPADAEVALAKALGQWPPKPPRRKLTLKDLAHTKAANAQANAKTSVEELAQRIGLKLGDQTELTIRRI
ncbi:MAG: DNA topoisomerase IB, partial [Bradyrhizobium sp.]|nr:DNA topoisomerase IB [Bradyrhizobium sp.]